MQQKLGPTTLVTILLYLAFTLAVWPAFLFVPQPAVQQLPDQDGLLDLHSASLEDTLYYYHNYRIKTRSMVSFRGQRREAPIARRLCLLYFLQPTAR